MSKEKNTCVIAKDTHHLLCMYSGGLDSLGALYKVLTDEAYKKHTIHVHHLNLYNRENRARAESIAVDKAIACLTDLFPNRFFLTQSSHDYRFMSGSFPYDAELVAFVAAQIVRGDQRIKGVAVGRNKSDVGEGALNVESRMRRLNRAQAIYKATLFGINFKTPDYIFPVLEDTKKDIYELLPKSLKDKFWSCRTPVFNGDQPEPCRRCETCKEVEKIITLHPS